jgi:nucleoside-diphosphate-sugar epimerase
MIIDIVGYKGDVAFDSAEPDGTMKKLLDSSRISQMGFKPTVGLAEGIKRTYEWYTKTQEQKSTRAQE